MSGKTPSQLDAEIAESLAHSKEFLDTSKPVKKRIPEDVRLAIETTAIDVIEGTYRRLAAAGRAEPCFTVGLVTDHLRQANMPADFRFATKQRQWTWVRSVLEALRRQGRLGSSIGADGRCYEPRR